jgi:membrane-bound lytic murein transglycosylase D
MRKILWVVLLGFSSFSQLYAVRDVSKSSSYKKPINFMESEAMSYALSHPRVQEYIAQFSTEKGMKFITDSLQRANPYIRYINDRIDYYDLPHTLIYLPVIESAYRINAVSYVGAAGIWQFMRGSAVPYGLVMDEWRDDRRDAYAATDAALRKIKYENTLLNDLWLVLAAYNCGVGRVVKAMKILKAQGLPVDFWTMYDKKLLPKETLNYVPKFIAVTYVGEQNNLVKKALDDSKEYHDTMALAIDTQLSIDHLADGLGISRDELRKMNSSLHYGITPPARKSPYYVKVPAALLDQAREWVQTAEPLQKSLQVYVVKSGDVLSTIAYRHNLSVTSLITVNQGLSTRSTIYPGQRILIPLLG